MRCFTSWPGVPAGRQINNKKVHTLQACSVQYQQTRSMKQLLVFVRKEFYHVFRDRRTLLILFGLPVAQILLFGFALTSEVKNAQIVVLDFARDEASRQIITRVEASPYFSLAQSIRSYSGLDSAFKRGTVKCALVLPNRLYETLVHNNQAQVQIITDASDPNTARTLTNYVTAIIGSYQAELNSQAPLPYQLHTEIRMLYNPDLNGSMNFVPGVIALVLMITCTTLTSVSVVREKETGTMEILLVSPFKPIYVIVSKAIPYFALSLVNLVIILLMAAFVLDMPVRGNIVLIFCESGLFIICCLSLGLLISSVTTSQQTAMLVSMMGMMLPTLLFTGFLFPLENMPVPLQVLSHIIPSRWFYLIIKAVMLKGLGFTAVWKETAILVGMTVLLLAASLKSFKIRLA